jgi:diguanylate cyclase (GGDEF)-like protein/PAS domain S-box-containing protein
MDGPSAPAPAPAANGGAPHSPPPGAGESPRATTAASRTGLVRWLIASAVAIAGAIVVGTVLIVSSLHRHALIDSQREIRNLAYMLAEESDRSMQAVELLQKSLIDRMERLGIASAADYRDRMSGYEVHQLLNDSISGLPHVETLSIFDAHGSLVNYNRSWPAPSLEVGDRDYFEALIADPNRASSVSQPLRNRTTGTWSLYLARKFLGPNREILGVVVGGLELKSFEDLFGSLVLDQGMDIALLRDDGTLLAQHPHVDAAIGTKDLRQRLLEDNTAVSDNTSARIVAMHALARHPAAVSVAAQSTPMLADWRTEAWYLVGAAVLIIVMIGAVATVTLRQFGSYALLLKARSDQAKAEAARLATEAVMAERELAREQLNEHKQQLDAAIDNMPQGFVMCDAEARIVFCNPRYMEMYHLPPDVAARGRRLHDVLAHCVAAGIFEADPDEIVGRILGDVCAGNSSRRIATLADGRMIDMLFQPLKNGGWISLHEDITERRRAERQLVRAERFLATVIENVPTTITVKDARDLKYLLINQAGERYFGLLRSEIIGRTAHDLFPHASADLIVSHDRQLLSAGKELFIDEHPVQTPAGQHRLVTARRLPIQDENGEPQYLLSLIEDVTERKQAEKRIAHIQQHDVLTGLPNRTLLAKHLLEKMERANTGHARFALLSVDLDRFKEVNDVFGQAMGDAVMREVSRRLEAAADGAFLAHVGSDEFVLTTADGPAAPAAEVLCERVLAALAEKIEIDDHQFLVGASIGVAMFPADGEDATALLGNADAALHRAKAEGRATYRFFEADLDRRLRDRRALHHDLLGAIERGELSLHYQPQAKIGGDFIGFEALLRWNHPTRGMVPPAEFIPLAEESGQILAIGEWVLRQACREAASWPRPLQIAVNVSPVQFRGTDIVGLIHAVLLETGLPANRLEVEITEGMLVRDFSHAVSILRRLKLLGVQIAMDDFGTGYSSLSYLRSIPFDKIKIDRSFVVNLGRDEQAGALMRGVIDLAHSLDLPVLAEGVETKDQFEMLQEAACDEVQGYLIGRPRPIEFYAPLVGATAAAGESALAS